MDRCRWRPDGSSRGAGGARGRDVGVGGGQRGVLHGARTVLLWSGTRRQMGGTQTIRTRRRGRGGRGYVLIRCPRGGARTVLLRRARWPVEGSVRTRRQMGGTQTINTRRRARGGRGYVLIRCPRGGARTVLLRRARWLVGGSVRTRRQMGGTQTIRTRRRGRAGCGCVVIRCRWGGKATGAGRRNARDGSQLGSRVVLQRRHAYVNLHQRNTLVARAESTTGGDG